MNRSSENPPALVQLWHAPIVGTAWQTLFTNDIALNAVVEIISLMGYNKTGGAVTTLSLAIGRAGSTVGDAQNYQITSADSYAVTTRSIYATENAAYNGIGSELLLPYFLAYQERLDVIASLTNNITVRAWGRIYS